MLRGWDRCLHMMLAKGHSKNTWTTVMSIGEVGGELSKTNLLRFHQIRSDVIATKIVKV